jgi:hypothetical protein
MPQGLRWEGQYRYDRLQVAPYAGGVGPAAVQVFRGDSGKKTEWNIEKTSVGSPYGSYVSNGLSNANRRFIAGVTDMSHAVRYQVTMASLQVPNAPSAFVAPTEASLAAAVAARRPTAVPGVETVEPGLVPAAAYPLTQIVYAAVDANADAQARLEHAEFIEYAATDGQEPGYGIGQLPPGYLPLPEALRGQALATAKALRTDRSEPGPSGSATPTDRATTPKDSTGPTAATSETPSHSPTVKAGAGPSPTLVPGSKSSTATSVPAASPAASTAPSPSTKPGALSAQPEAGDVAAVALPPQIPGADDAAVELGQPGGRVVPASGVATGPEVTAAAASTPATGALGGGLIAGIAGAAAGPVLLRRREGGP